MRYWELVETPAYINTKLGLRTRSEYLSKKDLINEFDFIGKTKKDGQHVLGFLSADHKQAVIGPVVELDDRVQLLEVAVKLSGMEDEAFAEAVGVPKLFAVSSVSATEESKGFGYAYLLYKMMLNAGWAVMSDNVHYFDGKRLWKRIVQRAATDKHKILVLDHGKLRRDEQGNPIEYDGTNIPEDEIWDNDGYKHYHTLLVAVPT